MDDDTTLHPHAVHVAKRFETLKAEKVDEPGDPRHGQTITGRRYVGPVDCPDCSRGFVSRGFDLICSQLPADVEIRACHEGCIVACGEVRSDG